MKSFCSRPECTCCLRRDTTVRVPEEIDDTLKLGLPEKGSIRGVPLCFEAKVVARLYGNAKYSQAATAPLLLMGWGKEAVTRTQRWGGLCGKEGHSRAETFVEANLQQPHRELGRTPHLGRTLPPQLPSALLGHWPQAGGARKPGSMTLHALPWCAARKRRWKADQPRPGFSLIQAVTVSSLHCPECSRSWQNSSLMTNSRAGGVWGLWSSGTKYKVRRIRHLTPQWWGTHHLVYTAGNTCKWNTCQP